MLPGKMDLLSPGVHLLYVCMSLLYVGCSEPLNIKFADGSTNKKKVQGSSSRNMCMYSLDLYLLTCMFGTVKSGTFCISDILVFRSLLKSNILVKGPMEGEDKGEGMLLGCLFFGLCDFPLSFFR